MVDPQGQAARAEEGRGEGPSRRAARRRAGLVGRPDAQLRAAPLPDGQGPAHRLRVRQPAGGLRRRHRRVPRGRHPLAPRRRQPRARQADHGATTEAPAGATERCRRVGDLHAPCVGALGERLVVRPSPGPAPGRSARCRSNSPRSRTRVVPVAEPAALLPSAGCRSRARPRPCSPSRRERRCRAPPRRTRRSTGRGEHPGAGLAYRRAASQVQPYSCDDVAGAGVEPGTGRRCASDALRRRARRRAPRATAAVGSSAQKSTRARVIAVGVELG